LGKQNKKGTLTCFSENIVRMISVGDMGRMRWKFLWIIITNGCGFWEFSGKRDGKWGKTRRFCVQTDWVDY